MHRLHQKAARSLLKATAARIWHGHQRLHAARDTELLEVSGYGSRPRDFDELLRILDDELRLITPTDPKEWRATVQRYGPATGEKYYQLTHDYLVPLAATMVDHASRRRRGGAGRNCCWRIGQRVEGPPGEPPAAVAVAMVAEFAG